MNLIPDGSICEYRIICVDAAQISENVLHYVATNAGAGVSDQAMVTAMDAFFGPLYKPILYNGAVYRGSSLQIIWPAPRRPAVIEVTNTGIGTAGAIGLPKQTCGFIAKLTNEASRNGRGRFYAPFPSTSNNTLGGTPTNGYQTNLLLLAAELLTVQTVTIGADSTSLTPVLYNRTTHADLALTNAVARQLWATQRRRGDFGRQNTIPF